jgi:precorrin-2/cobalt-factor-2 C20-methyltransferase
VSAAPATRGTIVGVGVGPGDPGLVTFRAVDVLAAAGAVMAPAPRRGGESLALSIVRPHLPTGCDIHTAHFPMTEDRDELVAAWDEAAATLLHLAAAGRHVAFITLGDAMLYSTWSYVLAAVRRLDPDAAVRTIPGVTAMAACAAEVGRPLAEGREPLLVWPDEPPADAAKLLEVAPNVVFMKAGRHLEALAAVAERAGADAVAVRRASQAGAAASVDLRAWSGDREYFTTVLMHRAGGGAPEGAPQPAQSEEAPA